MTQSQLYGLLFGKIEEPEIHLVSKRRERGKHKDTDSEKVHFLYQIHTKGIGVGNQGAGLIS